MGRDKLFTECLKNMMDRSARFLLLVCTILLPLGAHCDQRALSRPVQTLKRGTGHVPFCKDLLPSSAKDPFCLETGYEKHIRPNPRQPIKISVYIRVNEIEDVSAEGLSVRYHLQVTLRWVDERVNTTPAFRVRDSKEIIQRAMLGDKAEISRTIDTDYLHFLWVPDVTIYNLKQIVSLEMVKPQTALKIYRNSTLEYRFSARLTVGCSFFFNNYPIDRQVCNFLIGSSSMTKEEMVFQGAFFHPMETQRPLPVEYDLVKLAEEERVRRRVDKLDAVPRNFSVTGFTLKMTRLFGKNILQTYVPSGLFAYVSFISFLIDRTEQTGRLSMLVLLALLQVNILSHLKVPPSNGITAIQIYCLASLVCVVCAILEYAITICDQSPAVTTFQKITRKGIEAKRKVSKRRLKRRRSGYDAGSERKIDDKAAKHEGRMRKLERCCGNCFYPVYLDMCSICLFPTLFTAFNIGYWIYFLLEQNKEQ